MSLKNTQWNRAAPVILYSFAHSSLHPSTPTPVSQLTFQCDGLLLAVECDISSHHSLYHAKCVVLQIREGQWGSVEGGGSVERRCERARDHRQREKEINRWREIQRHLGAKLMQSHDNEAFKHSRQHTPLLCQYSCLPLFPCSLFNVNNQPLPLSCIMEIRSVSWINIREL